ncbi:amidohydrolase [Paramicrobacterium fandaimingii]|uniref:amidohydrolase n=1 Tax=Paramicrobacterium fandaimingii TaxID=2708079 RepID=UPI001FCFC4FA|nr:amidohydrolase family protein [Microbacterium fandaimingii]
MTTFRLRAAHPGLGNVQTLTRARLIDAPHAVDIELTDAVITDIRPAGSRPAAGEPVDLDGRVVMPGLWDHHVHFTLWSITSKRVDLTAAQSAAETATLIGHAAREHRDGPLVGVGFRDALWVDRPTAELLDAVVRDIPVVLMSADLHAVWLNTAALRRFGFTSDHGGLLTEDAAFAVQGQLDEIPESVSDVWADEAARAAAARGVTGITDMEMAWNKDVWERRTQEGCTHLRVSFGIYAQHLERAIEERLQSGFIVPHTHGLVSVGPFKIITDGSLNTRTAYCDDAYSGGDSGNGKLNIQPADLTSLMSSATSAGIDCAVHAIGDQANALALTAYEESGASGTIEHAQLMRPGDVSRMAQLGIAASVQPEHAMDDREIADAYWRGRTERSFMMRSFLDEGVRLAFGSDAPVAPLDPWAAVAAAVSRARDGKDPWHAEQSIGTREALAASVPNGRLTPRIGDTADLAILDGDPCEASAEQLRAMVVGGTILNGRWTHRAL